MKILNSNNKNFDKKLDSLLLQRKKKVQSNSVSVSSIIKDVRKNGDKALVKYEKRFNKNKKYLFQSPDERSRYIVYPKYISKVFPKDWINCEVPVIFDFAGELINDEKNKLYCLFPMRSWYYEVFEISCLSFINSTKKSLFYN